MSRPTAIHLKATAHDLEQAAGILRSGGLVAFPTETVYGLGADARNGAGVAKIFAAKERPSFNPLIVHIAEVEQAREFVVWSDMAEKLARAFWPGPLTLVLPLHRENGISELVTAGLDTLAIRVPAHATARKLLRIFGGPVAAPSANPSGRISATTAEHVLAGLKDRIAAVVDDGPCPVGLESTILGLQGTPTLLRPGGVAAEDIESCLGTALARHSSSDPLTAPGQMRSHYAPNAKVRLNAETARSGEVMLGFGTIAGDLNLSETGDLSEAAANLFGYLHQLDAQDRPIAVAPVPQTGLGLAINDRLQRAAAPRDQA